MELGGGGWEGLSLDQAESLGMEQVLAQRCGREAGIMDQVQNKVCVAWYPARDWRDRCAYSQGGQSTQRDEKLTPMSDFMACTQHRKGVPAGSASRDQLKETVK